MRELGLHRLLVIGLIFGLSLGCSQGTRNSSPAAASLRPASAPEPGLAQNPRNLIEMRESPYNNIYVYREGTNLCMTFGCNQKLYTETIYNTLDDRDLPAPYTRFMTASLIYPRQVKSILEIGSGGGRTAWYLHRFLPAAEITTVELDPTVADLSRKYFGLREETNFHMVTRDGRIFLASSRAKYDVILIDAYRGPFVPFHLLTREFYQLVADHLSEGGVVAQNLEASTMLFDSAVNTLHEVFPQVEFYDASGNDAGGNVVIVAYRGTPLALPALERSAEALQSTYNLRYPPQPMLEHRFELRSVMVGQKATFDVIDANGRATAGIDENAKVLTDDFAPVESLKAIERHNRKWNTTAQTPGTRSGS
jgi:spermidine synthase